MSTIINLGFDEIVILNMMEYDIDKCEVKSNNSTKNAASLFLAV